jgi:hypothetical protein
MYKVLIRLFTYCTGSIFRYKYSYVILTNQSYVSHMYHGCASPSIFDGRYSIDCALYHAIECPIVLTISVKHHWLAIIKKTLGA